MNTANNKNYMSSLAVEECNLWFSQQRCIARQENRSEIQPCI